MAVFQMFVLPTSAPVPNAVFSARLPPPRPTVTPLTSMSCPVLTRPAAVMRARSRLFVRITRSCSSEVPRKLLLGLVPALPISDHALLEMTPAAETWLSVPLGFATTKRSKPIGSIEFTVAPPRLDKVTSPAARKLPFTSSRAPGRAVPTPTLVPLSKIWLLPRLAPVGVNLAR